MPKSGAKRPLEPARPARDNPVYPAHPTNPPTKYRKPQLGVCRCRCGGNQTTCRAHGSHCPRRHAPPRLKTGAWATLWRIDGHQLGEDGDLEPDRVRPGDAACVNPECRSARIVKLEHISVATSSAVDHVRGADTCGARIKEPPAGRRDGFCFADRHTGTLREFHLCLE